MPTYSLQQTAFLMSMAASMENATGDMGIVEDLEKKLKNAIEGFLDDATVQADIGSWSIVWGPVVWEEGLELVGGNAMFVAKGTDAAGNDVYVVAVAATNFNSLYDVFTEDGDVTLTPWTYPLPSGATVPNVTTGTMDGVENLLGMSDRSGGSLQTYLGTVASTSATLVFTGHSLGGALSPALALALFADTMDTSDWGAVYLYPTAGPSVGDANYFLLWNSVFPVVQDASGETWNQLVWNTQDVVPQAWALLGQINTLYPSSDIAWTNCLANVQNGLLAKAATAGGTFVLPNNAPLTGTFVPWTGASSSSPMVTYFLVEMLYQHTYAYFDLLGVSDLISSLPAVTDPTASATAPSALTTLCTTLVGDYCYESQRGSACGSTSAGAASQADARAGDLAGVAVHA